MRRAARAWLVTPFLLISAADIALTLHGQPAAYRAGDYAAAVEANPFAYPFLVRGPDWFLAAATAWCAGFVAVVIGVRVRWVTWCAVFATVAHAVAGAAWLVRLERFGWPLAVAYLSVVTVAARACWARAGIVR